MARSVDAQKCGEWQRRLKRFDRSSSSVAEFCRDEGVSTASFYQWRRRLAGRAAQPVDEAADARSDFTPVRLGWVASVLVQLPSGTEVQIPTSDPEVLRLALEALARADHEHAGGAPC